MVHRDKPRLAKLELERYQAMKMVAQRHAELLEMKGHFSENLLPGHQKANEYPLWRAVSPGWNVITLEGTKTCPYEMPDLIRGS
jgi:hypothetical protein